MGLEKTKKDMQMMVFRCCNLFFSHFLVVGGKFNYSFFFWVIRSEPIKEEANCIQYWVGWISIFFFFSVFLKRLN